MTSSPPTTDPFAAFGKQYNLSRLCWASAKRGSLKQEPALLLHEDPNDGIIRVKKIKPSFQENTGIQVGYQCLQLQGKKIADYQGGFEEIQRTLEESQNIEVVVLKPSKSSTLVTPPKKTMRGPKLNDPGEKGWVKISPIPKKNKLTTPVPKKDKEPYVDLPFIPRIWASNKRSSISAPVPFQVAQDDDGAIRICHVGSALRKKTSVRVGQQLVQLQERDIDSYHDLEEIQAIIEDALEINFAVINSKQKGSSTPAKKHKKKKKKRRPSVSSADSESTSGVVPESEATIHTAASSGAGSVSWPTSESSISAGQANVDPALPSATPTKKSKGSWLKSKLLRSGRKVSSTA